MIGSSEPHSATPKTKAYFELWRVFDTERMVLKFGDQEMHFHLEDFEDLKKEIRGWELRYYEG